MQARQFITWFEGVEEPGPVLYTLKGLVAAICVYEFVAITADFTKMQNIKLPTVSAMCRKHPSAVPIILAGLGLHLSIKPKEWDHSLKG